MKRFWSAYLDAYRGLPAPIWWLSAVLFVNRSGSMVLFFLALWVTEDLGHGVEVAGWLLSAWGAGHVLGAWLGGWLTDRIGALRVQIRALALAGVGFIVLGHAESLWTIGLVIFLTATVSEGFRPANAAAVAAIAPDALQTRAVALNRMALNLGVAIGPAVGGWLAMKDYGLLFVVDGISCIAASVVLVALVATGRVPFRLDRPDRRRDEASRHPVSDPAFLAFLGLALLFSMAFLQGWATYAIYLKAEYGIDEAGFGLLLTVNALLIFFTEVPITHQTERFRPLWVFGIGALLLTGGLAILPFGHSWTFALFGVLVWTLGEMLAIPAAGGWVALRAGPEHRGRYMGLYTMAWGVAWMAGPILGTTIYERLGGDVLWYSVGIAGATVLVLAVLLQRAVDRGWGRVAP